MLKDRVCKYCGKLFKNIEGKIFSNHVRWCDKNPKDRTEEFKTRSKKIQEAIDKKKGKIKEFEVKCSKCGKSIIVKEREKEFPKKKKYYCSRQCANSHIRSDASKKKTSDTMLAKYNHYYKHCKRCNKEYSYKSRSKFCSDVCRKLYKIEKSLNKAINDSEKEKILIRNYRNECSFKFNLSDYPDKFDFNLIKQFGWYKAKNHGNNINGISRDHMYSIMDGYVNHIDPKIISHPANCRLIRHKENQSKGKHSCITLEELLERIKNW